jgi:hypothetical protein
VSKKQNSSSALPFKGAVLTFLFATAFLAVSPAHTGQQDKRAGMPGMDMHDHEDMSSMGPSMIAMAGHVYMTPLRPKQPGDLEKAKAIVAEMTAAIERYKDYRKALLDGYDIANPKLKQPPFRPAQTNSLALPANSKARIHAGGRDVYRQPRRH